MAFSKTQIVNKALVKLGARPIVNIDTDDTPESRAANNVYDIALEGMLSEIRWTFATKRALLAQLDETIPFNRDYEILSVIYQRPVDAIRIFEVNDTGADWLEESDRILSDTEGLGVIYAVRNTNTATYPAQFVNAFADLLAAEMAYPILNSVSKSQELMGLYESVSLPKAEAQNSQIGTAKELNDNYWLNARHGGGNVKEHS